MAADAPQHTRALLLEARTALDDLFALMPEVLPDTCSLLEREVAEITVLAVKKDATGRLIVPTFWIYDREDSPSSAHLSVQRAAVSARFVACLERLDAAARAIAPGLWAQADGLRMVYRFPDTLRGRLTFSGNGRDLRESEPGLFTRSLLWMLDAAQGIPQGPHMFGVCPTRKDSWERRVWAATAEDAATLDMIIERAHHRWGVPVEVPCKVKRITETEQDPALLAQAKRLNTLPPP